MLAAHEHHVQDGQTEVRGVRGTGHNLHQECLAQLREHSAEVETLLQVLLCHGGLVAGAEGLDCLLGAGLKLLVVLALQPGQQGDRVEGDDAEGESGGVTLDTGDVVIGRGDPPPLSGSPWGSRST